MPELNTNSLFFIIVSVYSVKWTFEKQELYHVIYRVNLVSKEK